MSDYISTVTSRSIGISEGIRPKVPSLFEPMVTPSMIADTILAEEKVAQSISERDDQLNTPENHRSSEKGLPPESGSHLAMPISSKNINARVEDKEKTCIDPPRGETQEVQRDHFAGGLDEVESSSPERLSVHGEYGVGNNRFCSEKEPLLMDAPGVEATPDNDPKIPEYFGNMRAKAQLSPYKNSEGAIDHQSLHTSPSGLTKFLEVDSSPSLHSEFRSPETQMKNPVISDSSGSKDIKAGSFLDKHLGAAIDHQSPYPLPSGLKETQKADFSTSPRAELSPLKGGDGVQSPISIRSSHKKKFSIIHELMPIAPSSGRMQEPSQRPPVIKVTIGKIEVKAAIIPEKKTSAPAAKARSISLDEYLLSLKRQ